MLTDDQGFGDFSLHGNPRLETPHMDQLGCESLRFTDFYVNPACAPTRASLLTGRHFHRTGTWWVHGGRDALNRDEVTLPELLNHAGYRTGMIGKWHNGKTGPFLPWNRGFEEAWSKSGLYNHSTAKFIHNGKEVELEGWARDRIADLAIDFMKQNREEPFFLYLPFPTPHGPAEAPQEYVDKYLAKGCGENLAATYAMIDHLDENIGRILAGMEELGLSENTAVFFLSDNGPSQQQQTDEEFAERNPIGWRGAKGQIWENGVRSHLFVRWPGHTKPGETDIPAQVTDLFPTIAQMAGASLEDLKHPLDGRSLVPVLNGEAPSDLKNRYLYNTMMVPEWEGKQADRDYLADRNQLEWEDQIGSVRHQDFKLVKTGPEWNLYNLAKDPGETTDVKSENPKVFDDMKERLTAWYKPIIEDPKLFRLLPQPIGWPGESSDKLWLNQNISMSPGINSHVRIEDMNQPGDEIVIAADVMQAGKYDVILHGTTFPGAKWELSLGSHAVVSEASGSGDIPLGTLDLDETGRFDLTLKLLEAPKGGPAMKFLFYLGFTKQSDGVTAE